MLTCPNFSENSRKIDITLDDAVYSTPYSQAKKCNRDTIYEAFLPALRGMPKISLPRMNMCLQTALLSVESNPITTHKSLPLKSGCSLTSTDAKKLSVSTCKTIRFSRLSVSELQAASL